MYNYPYGNSFDDNEFLRQKATRKGIRREIRYVGLLLGGAILLCFFIQEIAGIALQLTGLYEKYTSDETFSFVFDTVLTVVSMLVPFSLAGKLIAKRSNIHYLAPTDFPKDKKLVALGIPMGIGFCMLGNIVTSWISTFFSAAGHELTAPELNYPEGIAGFLLSTIRVAVIAAIVEELCFRGTALQSLRRFGNGFAVFISAAAFGMMHMNLVQAPFALIAGVGLAWVCIATNSIWPSMAIHFLNNFLSVAAQYLLESGKVSEEVVTYAYAALVYSMIGIGGFCAYFFFKRVKPVYFGSAENLPISGGMKFLAFISNPTIIIVFIYMVYATSLFIS